MTRDVFALAVRATPAWIINTERLLGHAIPRTEHSVRLYALIRMLQHSFGFALPDAVSTARRALSGPDDALFVARESVDGSASLLIDMARFHLNVSIALSSAKYRAAPKARGRMPNRPKDPVAAAAAYGEDISQMKYNLARSPAVLLESADEDAAFVRAIRFVR